VHADLFRDNVMFEGEQLTGFFDFYFAGVDTWLFDLAVCLNDWCIDLPTGRHDAPRPRPAGRLPGRAPLTAAERELLPAMARRGAAFLDLAPVGLLPAARSRHAHTARPHAL
jgi:homoserine kinase type II